VTTPTTPEKSSIAPDTVKDVSTPTPAPSAVAPPVVEFKNVSKIYDGGTVAIKDVRSASMISPARASSSRSSVRLVVASRLY
jgi:hypothetical protein